MSSKLYINVPPEMRLKAAGFRIENVEADPSIIYMLNPELEIVYCNKAWDQFASENGGAGLSRGTVLGTPILDIVAGPLKAFYASGLAKAKETGRPWEHDYECSSPDSYRFFHMRVLPLENWYLLVESSLRIERPHGSERPAMPANAALYVSEDGIVTMCSHCRRTQRVATAAMQVWDWVPAYLEKPPGPVSHGLCRNCRAYFYTHP